MTKDISAELLPLPNGGRGVILALYLDLTTPPPGAGSLAQWDRQRAQDVQVWLDRLGDASGAFLVDSAVAPMLLRMIAGGRNVQRLPDSDPLASAIDNLTDS
jgi:hypothetical protein